MNSQPEKKQSKNSVAPICIGIALGAAFNAAIIYGYYQKHLNEAQEMKEAAPYDVSVISSRDGKNKDGESLTSYLLSKDYMLHLHECRFDNSSITTNIKINKTLETSYPDIFLYPDAYKMEMAKTDFRVSVAFYNSFHLYDLLALDSLNSDQDQLKQNIQDIVQRDDEKYFEKTTLLDFSVEENPVDGHCRNKFTQMPLYP